MPLFAADCKVASPYPALARYHGSSINRLTLKGVVTVDIDIIANLKAAIAAVEAQPESSINLGVWNCNTHFCIGGLCAVTPHFTAQGMYAHSNSGEPCAEGCKTVQQVLWRFFGTYGSGGTNSAYWHIFVASGQGAWDAELEEDGELPDKQLALARLRRALAYQETAALA
jgi:hypothetical protein